MSNLPIMRPKMPRTEQLLTYLEQIDQNRVYTNFGPLSVALEDRLARHYGLDEGMITAVANATLGLSLALSAVGAKPGALCIMPAWTFVASAHAAVGVGLTPYFMDVSAETWSLEPSTVEAEIAQARIAVGAVMPVAPFGRPIDIAAWDAFRLRTGIPVVVDAAAGFDSLIPGIAPAVVSLHATKVLGTGEGGLVISTDQSVVERVRGASNFGFCGTREASVPATNAKMSEYHAALGHAALDEWTECRAQWMRAAGRYRALFQQSPQVRLQDGFGREWVSSTCVLHSDSSSIIRIGAALASAGIETRHWWGKGAHTHPATSHFPRNPLRATENLAASTIALPLHRDLARSEIERVAEIVIAASREPLS
jgi:dTDP-4-amino-4,6-dideoxygalactose transaminase